MYISKVLPKLKDNISYKYKPETFLKLSECFEKHSLCTIFNISYDLRFCYPNPLIIPATANALPLNNFSS